MPWLRVDDRMYCHRKVAGLALEPFALWVMAMDYSADQLTDGVLKAHELQMLAAMRRITDWQAAVNELVAAELLDATLDGSYILHDYLEYNPSRADVLKERARNAHRQAEWQAGKRREQEPEQAPANTAPNSVSNGVSKHAPYPGPYPYPSSTTGLPPQPETEDDPVVDRLMGYQVTYTQAIQCAAGRDALAMAWMDYLDAHRHGIPNPAAFLVKSIKAGKPPPSNGLGPPGTSPPRVTGLSEADLEVQRERQRAAQTAARAGPAPPA